MDYIGKNTIFDYLSTIDIPDCIHTMALSNSEIINFEIVNYLSDTTFSTSPVLGDSIVDTKMLILKFHKNLTINSGVTITPQVRKKGMCIYCEGTLTNNGIISMTARGANAVGQDVLLYKNFIDKSYEYIPKLGSSGTSGGGTTNPTPAVNRKTGGGAGGTVELSFGGTGGNGAAGTSYSGGAGGGSTTRSAAGSGTINGGAGGYGAPWSTYGAGGGAGNPGSSGSAYGGSGTGGLLIIYCNTLINNSQIISEGTAGGVYYCYGGGSGGGSINIFSQLYTNNGSLSTNGVGVGSVAGGIGCIMSTKYSNVNLYRDKSINKVFSLDINKKMTYLDDMSVDTFNNYGNMNLNKVDNNLFNNTNNINVIKLVKKVNNTKI